MKTMERSETNLETSEHVFKQMLGPHPRDAMRPLEFKISDEIGCVWLPIGCLDVLASFCRRAFADGTQFLQKWSFLSIKSA